MYNYSTISNKKIHFSDVTKYKALGVSLQFKVYTRALNGKIVHELNQHRME